MTGPRGPQQGTIKRFAQWATLWLLTLVAFGVWLLPWEHWTTTQRDVWVGAVIVCGFTLILADRRP